MHTIKIKVNQLNGILNESNRKMYKKDTASHSLIDKNKSSQNYNMSMNDYKQTEVYSIISKILKRKPRKDAVIGGTIITLPSDYTGDTYDFFQVAYEGLKSIYNIREEDVISSYVHLDETTPHMHFYFIPHQRKYNEQGDLIGESCSWDKTMPRSMYQKQHRKLEEYFRQNGREAHLLNGKTLGINLQNMSAEQKKKQLKLIEENRMLMTSINNQKQAVKQYTEAIQKATNLIDKLMPYKNRFENINTMQMTEPMKTVKKTVNHIDLLIKQGQLDKAETLLNNLEDDYER